MTEAKITITEALADLKTIDSRVDKSKEFVLSHICRQACLSDPLKDEGGQKTMVTQRLQSAKDLFERKVKIRNAINAANQVEKVTVEDETRTVAEWLIWRREVAEVNKKFLNDLLAQVNRLRNDANAKRIALVTEGESPKGDMDLIVNVPEKKVFESLELVNKKLSVLDGLLSVKNATTYVTV